MTDDIVKRLRDRGMSEINCLCGNPVCEEAADRIEELERHVELRDWFLVDNGLWEKFAKGAQEKKDD